jgi:hypothetical protein
MWAAQGKMGKANCTASVPAAAVGHAGYYEPCRPLWALQAVRAVAAQLHVCCSGAPTHVGSSMRHQARDHFHAMPARHCNIKPGVHKRIVRQLAQAHDNAGIGQGPYMRMRSMHAHDQQAMHIGNAMAKAAGLA